ncbi:MAG: LamG domain-containing protein, partial [Gammaproteobacteria bacterium]|nr:LamG domain-containing protein [Gammaproteobacteria bacterium]
VDNFGDTYTGAVEIELQSTDLGSCLIPPLAYYAMDETLWNGDADSVIDSSANGYHGQAMTGATTSNTTPAISGLSGTCNYAEFDGTDDHINVKKTPDLDADFTIATWIYAKNTLGKQIIYADDVNKNTGFSIEIGSDEIVVNSRNVTPTSYSTVGSAIVQNQWHHIAVVHDSDAKTIKVYIDGVSQTLSASLYSGNWLADVGEESIAGDATNSASFDGFIDEFRVYDEAFTASQVELVKGLTHLCGNQVGHYAISHSSNGVTCEAESITISAHGNTHALVAPSAGTTITLSTSEAVDGWSLKSGNGSFDGVNKYTFDGVETSVEFWLSKSIPTTSPHININVTDGSSTDPNDGGAEDPVIAFSDSTFRFYADDVNNDINTQTAFKSSAGDQVLTLKAVETNTDTGACETRLDGAQTVELAYECVTPSTCANNNAVIIDSKPIVGNASGNVTDYTDVSLNFVNGVATWDLKYDDAGKIALHVNKVVAESGSDPEVSLTARSNEFVVKPAGLCVYSDDVGSSCTSSDASCSKFKKAGEAFNLKVKAVGWGGSVENNAQLCDNNITDNFSLSNIALSHSLIAPTTGVPGNISTTLFDMSSGEFIDSSLTFSEVGVFTFTVTPPNYLSEAIAPSTSNNIGRIYPDHFSISNESLINRSDSVVGGIFSYMAESFKIGFTLVAENSSDDTTENYEGAFAKLDSGSEIGTGAVDGGAVDLTSRLVSSNSSFSWTKGTGTLTDTLSFTRQATVDGPYENLSIGVTPHDNDGVTLELFNLDTDLDSINEQHSIGSTKIRFGRMNISSAAGSELQDLSIPLTVEYYNGTSFITNTDDSATGFSIANISMGNQYESAQTDGTISVTGTHTSVLTSLVAFSAGDAGLSLSHPCLVAGPSCAAVSGATGYVDLDLTVGVPYLLFDWDNDVATSDTSPTTIKATFGIFTGNSKMTYIRESY